METKLIIIIVFLIVISACSPLKKLKEPVAYKSTDFIDLTGVYALEAVFYPDHTFEYIIQGQKYDISGNWELKRDTVYLYSNKFFEESIFGGYQNKFTLAPAGKDIYLIKGKYLYEIIPEKVKSLVKASKKHMEALKSK